MEKAKSNTVLDDKYVRECKMKIDLARFGISKDALANVCMRRIPPGKKRERIAELMDAKSRHVEDVYTVFDEIGQIAGLEIRERRNCHEVGANCLHYVFGEVNQDVWWKILWSTSPHLRFDPLPFLAARGYVLTEKPQKGDIVAYIQFDREQDVKAVAHMGIYQGKDQVTSKFNWGYVYDHEISLVSSRFGDEVIFFTKVTTPPASRAC